MILQEELKNWVVANSLIASDRTYIDYLPDTAGGTALAIIKYGSGDQENGYDAMERSKVQFVMRGGNGSTILTLLQAIRAAMINTTRTITNNDRKFFITPLTEVTFLKREGTSFYYTFSVEVITKR